MPDEEECTSYVCPFQRTAIYTNQRILLKIGNLIELDCKFKQIYFRNALNLKTLLEFKYRMESKESLGK